MQRSPPQQRYHPPARKTHKLASTQFSVFFSFWIIQAIFGPHPASRGRCRPGSSSPPPHIPPHPLPSRPISSRSSILTAAPSFTWIQLLAWNQQTSRDTVAPQDGQPIAWTNSCPGCIRTCMRARVGQTAGYLLHIPGLYSKLVVSMQGVFGAGAAGTLACCMLVLVC